MTPEYPLHDWDPLLFRFTSSEGIYWYGVAYVLSWTLCIAVWLYWSKKNICKLPQEYVLNFSILIFLSMLIGGRLGHCLGLSVLAIHHVGIVPTQFL